MYTLFRWLIRLVTAATVLATVFAVLSYWFVSRSLID